MMQLNVRKEGYAEDIGGCRGDVYAVLKCVKDFGGSWACRQPMCLTKRGQGSRLTWNTPYSQRGGHCYGATAID
jgi:hypothetical protein